MSSSPGSTGSGRTVGRARGRTTTEQVKEERDKPGGEHKRPRVEATSEARISERRGSNGNDGKGHLPAKVEEKPRAPSPSGSASGSVAVLSRDFKVPRFGMRRRQQQAEQVHTRPKHINDKRGTTGRPLTLLANYFKLRSMTDWVLYQHHVNFSPSEDRIGVKKALVKVHKDKLGGYIFDGALLFTSKRLPEPLVLTSVRQGDSKEVTMKVTLTRQLQQSDYEYLQFFNILMRKCLGALKLQLVGRNYFDPVAKIAIDQFKLELWPGYVTSIRQHEQEILLCSEITHKVMRRETVHDLLVKVQQQHGHNWQAAFKSAVLGLVVLTDYNNRTYRVDDVNFDLNPLATFHMKDRHVSYTDYYYQKYSLRICNPYQPLLVSKSKSRQLRAGATETVFLVPELCRMTGLTDDMRTNFQLMKAVAEYTRVGPGARIQKLIAFSHRLMGQPVVREDLMQWNMNISPQLVAFPGRVLNPEIIVQGHVGNVIKYPVGRNSDWTSSLRSKQLLNIAKVRKWVVMCPHNCSRDAERFINLVIKAAGGMEMYMEEPYVEIIPDDRQGTYVNALEAVLSFHNPSVVVCIVSNNRADRYAAIKKKCLVDRAVPSQVITARSLTNKGALSIATKVAIQINCKLGGSPWTVENPCQSDMVVGFDVSHDTMNKRISYGAMVASLNNTMSRYFSAVSTHQSGEELSNELSINLLKALQKFREANNGMLPARIFIYRDGVGDGQIDYVNKHEVAVIRDKLAQIYKDANRYRLTFIIVCKRINTRIFTANHENPEPGTVVDNCITLPERYDFFLVSQSVRQGTVSPTSYNVIFDNSGLSPDLIQRFTYKMTHLYYNWSGTVRVPAPVQYAHKLAMLVGQSLHRLPTEELDTTLYFL